MLSYELSWGYMRTLLNNLMVHMFLLKLLAANVSTHILRIVLVQLMEHTYVLKFHKMKHRDIVGGKIFQHNILAACTFDLKFTYVLAGWEGTASDSRIMKEALNRQDPLKIPEGKFYLVDAGFMLRSGLITPYRGERYHLKEYSRNPPRNSRELFNLRHASLRNAIERAFGVLKKRFPIISSSTESSYVVDMAKNTKEFASSNLKAPDNSICFWTNAMDDTLVDAYCHENVLGHRVGGTFSTHAMDNILKELKSKFPDKIINKDKIHNRMKIIKKHFTRYYDIFQIGGMNGFAWDPITNMFIAEPEVWDQLIQSNSTAADLKNKPCRNYEKMMILYGKDRATRKHAETGPDMLKRNARKNLKKSNDDLLTIDEVDEMIHTNAASLENIGEYGHSEQSDATDYTPTPNAYPEAPSLIRNKKSKHDHFESMADTLRGGMDKLASAIGGLSSALPISESEIWNMLAEMNLESRVNTKAYISLCQNASAYRTLIGCPKEARKAILLEMMQEDN